MAEASVEFELSVERGKIREFAQAVGDDNPLFLDPDVARGAGFPDVLGPPTFTVTDLWQVPLGERLERLGLELDPARMLHAEQEYMFTRLPIAGELLRGSIRICDDVEKMGGRGGKMRFVTLETRYVDTEGDEVLIAYYTLVETAKDPGA